MKFFIIFVLLTGSVCSATTKLEDGACEITGIPKTMKEDGTLEGIVEKVQGDEAKRLDDFTQTICMHLVRIDVFRGDSNKLIENEFFKYLKINPEVNSDYKRKIVDFWNANSDKFICKNEEDPKKTRTPIHFVKRALAYTGLMTPVFSSLLFTYPKMNFNAIEVYNGKKETIIDYIERIEKDPEFEKKYNPNEITSLKNQFKYRFKAKRASEL